MSCSVVSDESPVRLGSDVTSESGVTGESGVVGCDMEVLGCSAREQPREPIHPTGSADASLSQARRAPVIKT